MDVIACSRPWCEKLAENLQRETGEKFALVGSKSELTVDTLESYEPKYVFFPHWSSIIPEEIFSRFECVIFHMTDVPYGRGGSPLQNLIIRGHKETKLTALKCVKEMDAGPVYLKESLSLLGNAEEIYMRASALIEKMIGRIISENPHPVVQKGDIVKFKRRKPEEGDWSSAKDLDQVYDMIRMLDADGYPKAFVRVGKYKLEFTRASRTLDGVYADVKIVDERLQ